MPLEDAWAWELPGGRTWWAKAQGAPALARHQGAWWWRTEDGWFLLKGGQAWAWRHVPGWEGGGFFHPGTGTEVVYSADGKRLAVITPHQDTLVFDALTGALLARIPQVVNVGTRHQRLHQGR
ncbi:MAG: hypothetical protein KGL53_04075 [Elusimicrobia bacterium]|nr:hypothetical protein [Elusimicrobiota bacterium]